MDRREWRGAWGPMVVVLGFLQLCSAFYGGRGHSNGDLSPDDPFVFVGENLTLTCNLTNMALLGDWRNLIFKRNGQLLKSSYVEKADVRAVQLNYPIRHSDKGLDNVSCWLQNESGRHLVATQYIHVDYPAGRVQNLSCTAPNWENLTCTWDLPYTYHYPDFVEVKVTLSQNRSTGRCCQPAEQNKTSATWTSGGGRGFVWGLVYTLRVKVIYDSTGRDRVYKKSRRLFIRTREKVKPSPISDWHEANRSSNTVWIQVLHMHSAFHDKRLYLQYASQWNQTEWLEKNVSWPKHTNPLEVEVSNLRPFTHYTVRVAVGPSYPDEGFLSDWRNFTVQTAPGVPDMAPELCSGCYSMVLCNTSSQHCQVRLYWKSIPRPLRNSELKGYLLEVTSMTSQPRRDQTSGSGRSSSLLTSSEVVGSEDSSPPSPAASIQEGGNLTSLLRRWASSEPSDGGVLSPQGECGRVETERGVMDISTSSSSSSQVTVPSSGEGSVVRLWAVTIHGRLSRSCSLLFLPSVEDKPEGVKNLVVEVDDYQAGQEWNGRFYLRWLDHGSNTAFFTLFWCHGNRDIHSCSQGEDIQWLQVWENHTQLQVNVSDKDGHDLGPEDFIVGISRHQRRHNNLGDVSSGIEWSSCVYLRNKQPQRSAKDIGLVPGNSEGELRLSWTYRSCTSDVNANVYVTQFAIYYCSISQEKACDGAEKTVSVGGEQRFVTLEGLEEGRVYQVRVAPVSLRGQGPLSKPLFGVATVGVKDKGITILVISVVPVCLAAIVGIVCVVYKCCRHHRKVRRMFADTLEEDSLSRHYPSAFVMNETGGVSKPHTPLLPGDNDTLQVGEEGSLGGHDVNQSSSPDREILTVTQPLLLQQISKSTCAQGSDSGVELRHSAGDSDEAATEGIPGSPNSAADPCAAAKESSMGTKYVARTVLPSQLSPVLSHDGKAVRTSSDFVTGLGSPQVIQAEVHVQDSENVGDFAELSSSTVSLDSDLENLAIDDLIGTGCSRKQVDEEKNGTQVLSIQPALDGYAKKSNCGGLGTSQTLGNGYAKSSPYTSNQLSKHSLPDELETECPTVEGSLPSLTSMESDIDEEAVAFPDLSAIFYDFSPPPGQIQEESSGDDVLDLLKASPNLDLTMPTLYAADNGVEVSNKNSGGCVVVSPHPRLQYHPDSSLPSLSSYLIGTDLSQGETDTVPSRTSECGKSGLSGNSPADQGSPVQSHSADQDSSCVTAPIAKSGYFPLNR